MIHLEKAIEINPQNASNYIFKGLMAMEVQNFEIALQCFTKSTQLDESNSEAWYQLGEARIFAFKR